MENRNITLTLDKAKEWYNKGGELKEVALQAYKEEELTKIELPKTWEEFYKNYPSTLGENWIPLPSKEMTEAYLALTQIHLLRDCYRQGWVPDWKDNSTKHIIRSFNGIFTTGYTGHCNFFLSFQTEEIAKEFLENFRDLIEKAGDLI